MRDVRVRLRWSPGLIAMLATGCHFGFLGVIEATRAPGAYVPESIAREIGPSAVRTIGCLDVGLVPFQRGDREMLDVHVGNRCEYPESLDLRRLVIRGDGDRDVTLSDPRGEIDLVHVGGADRGRERIRLEGVGEASRLCFHLDRVDPDAPAARPVPLCFARAGDAWRPG